MVLNDDNKGRIIEMSSFGMTHRDIASKNGRGKNNISDFLKKFKDTGEAARRSRLGRKGKTTVKEER